MRGAWIRLLAGIVCAALLGVMTFLAGQRSEGSRTGAGETTNPQPEPVAPIAPGDFLVAPCAGVAPEAVCLIIAAGGKRVLIGAPAGIGAGLTHGDKTPPDRILLFSLYASQIEGLDELRNRAWASGQRTPLTVAAGRGIDDLVEGLNAAYTVSDALAYVDGTRAGGFNVAAMEARALDIGDIAFDTGDLTITALRGGPERYAYLVTYQGTSIVVADCGARAQDVETWPDDLAGYIGCELEAGPAELPGNWPLRARVQIELRP